MAMRGDYLTIRLQQHSSGTANAVIADTVSCSMDFSGEALDTTSQDDALIADFIAGKLSATVTGDYLLMSDATQFSNLFSHIWAGNTVEVELYQDSSSVLSCEGIITSLTLGGGNSDSLATGAYSMQVTGAVTEGDGCGPVLNTSNCVNLDYTSFINASPTGFDAIANGSKEHNAGSADEIPLIDGQQMLVEFDLVLNTGTAPFYDLTQELGFGSFTVDGDQLAAAGSNSFLFTITGSTTGALEFKNDNTASNYEITNLSIRNKL